MKWMFENCEASIPLYFISLLGVLDYLSKNPVPLYQKNAFKEITSQYNLANDKVWTLAEQPKFS